MSEFEGLEVRDPDSAWSIISKTQQFLPIPTTTQNHNSEEYTRITCMSDTHGKHRNVLVPKCDVLIHAGDFTKSGEGNIVSDIGDFFQEILNDGRAKKVVCIAGNHDITFQAETYRHNWKLFHPQSGMADGTILKNELKDKCNYLEDQSLTENNVQYYGSPWTPIYGHCWAFMKDRNEIHEKWSAIPSSTDVLITHGPPLGRGDLAKTQYSRHGTRAGCLTLLQTVQNRVKPRIHIFGHIHEGAGCSFDGTTIYANASNCTIRYKPEQECVVIDLPNDPSKSAVIVLPTCTYSGEEVLEWLKIHGYDNIYPYFETHEPLLDGSVLVCEDLDVEHMACTLGMHRNWKQLKDDFLRAIRHLRCDSY